ncbi:MAG: 16S rRNA (guanine(527)-N(7))-methyltransferase RsmG [Bacteroidota bacterium]
MAADHGAIARYFPDLSDQQKARFDRLPELYADWNARINVISRKDIDHLMERHVLHALGIANVLSFQPGTQVLDVGTGGGFPGIPLAILFPESRFHLIDSIGKKIKVVQAVAEALELDNVTAEQVRAEQHDKRYDFVVSRAVTALPRFLGWLKGTIRPGGQHTLANGILYLKGGDLQEELKGVKGKAVVYPLSDYYSEAFFETKAVVYVPAR